MWAENLHLGQVGVEPGYIVKYRLPTSIKFITGLSFLQGIDAVLLMCRRSQDMDEV